MGRPSFTTSSNFLVSRRAPKAFLLFLFVFLLTESLLFAAYQFLPPRHSPQRVLRMIERQAFDAEILILGDSFATNAFFLKDTVFAGTAGWMYKTLSLSTDAGVTMAGQYFILKRYLKKNRTPQAVFFVIYPGVWANGIGPLADNEFFSCFTRMIEIWDVLQMTGHLNFALKALYYKFFPSAQLRFYFAEYRGASRVARRLLWNYLRGKAKETFELLKPRPLVAEPAPFDREKLFRKAEARIPPFSADPLNGSYFERICRLASEKKIKLYYLSATLPESLHGPQRPVLGAHDQFIDSLGEKCPNLIVLENFVPPYLEDEYFFDTVHFNEKGAVRYLGFFNESLNRLMKAARD